MKALILCAGQGTRLLPHTRTVPKCLVPVCDVPILEYQLSALRGHVDEIVLATGYLEEQVRRFAGARSVLVHNEDFATTNSLYSLWLAREHVIDSPFILLNGDLIFDGQLLDQLVEHPGPTALLVDDRLELRDGEMNVVTRDGLVQSISKSVVARNADAQSLQIAKFGANDSRLLLERVEELIDTGGTNLFPTNAYAAIIERSAMAAVPRRLGTWFEIDTVEDLAYCEDALRKRRKFPIAG